jgi:hypothetical protein
MRFDPRPYQTLAVDHAAEFLLAANPGQRQGYAAPTGTGKSVIELLLQERFPDAWILTPRLEIVAGMLDKLGCGVGDSEASIVRVGMERRITTPVRMRNLLLGGRMSAPGKLIIDESHHDLCATHQDIHLLTGLAPAVGFTATPYRGTPAGTAAFRQVWGEPLWILTYPEAVQMGVLAFPSIRVEPLVDDDEIEISNGELVVSQIEAATLCKLDYVIDLCRPMRTRCGNAWDMPTMFAVPSVELAYTVGRELMRADLPALYVTGESTHAARQAAFDACIGRQAALVQVNVVSEGVDLPIRRLVDLSPTLSPVKWLQQLGRIMRPGDVAPEYICCNRNLLRHAYLLEGCLPNGKLAEAQQAFPEPAKRLGMRVVGLEGLGRFKAVELPLASGVVASCYALSTVEGAVVTQYFAIVHPGREEPIWARKTNLRDGEDTKYGRWARCEAPTDVRGFASVTPSELSDKQAAWWKRAARHFGLDPDAKVTRKSFQALPVLADLKVRLR